MPFLERALETFVTAGNVLGIPGMSKEQIVEQFGP